MIRVLRGVRLCRIQAAINAGVVKDVYKTQLCAKGYCRRLHCTYYHDESDRLPMIGYKAQYCKAYKASPFCSNSLLPCALLPYSKCLPLRLENIRRGLNYMQEIVTMETLSIGLRRCANKRLLRAVFICPRL